MVASCASGHSRKRAELESGKRQQYHDHFDVPLVVLGVRLKSSDVALIVGITMMSSTTILGDKGVFPSLHIF